MTPRWTSCRNQGLRPPPVRRPPRPFDEDLASHADSATVASGQESGDVRNDRTAEDLATSVLVVLQGGFVLALSDRDRPSLESVRLTLATLVRPPD